MALVTTSSVVNCKTETFMNNDMSGITGAMGPANAYVCMPDSSSWHPIILCEPASCQPNKYCLRLPLSTFGLVDERYTKLS